MYGFEVAGHVGSGFRIWPQCFGGTAGFVV